MIRKTIVTFFALVFLAACSSDSKSEKDAGIKYDAGIWDGGVTGLQGSCSLDERVGGFLVQFLDFDTPISGKVLEAPIPSSTPILSGEEGGCRLWKRVSPQCTPPCQPGETCDYDETCIPYPLAKSLGVVTVQSFTDTGPLEPVIVQMEPMNNQYFNTDLPANAFNVGDSIRLTAQGEEYSGFRLYGYAVTPMEPPEQEVGWVIYEEEPLPLTWTPSDDPFSIIEFVFNVDQHGNSPINMVCEFEDTGSAEVPASIIEEFLDNGISGVPWAYIKRKTVDKIEIEPGCVDFEVSHLQNGTLSVDGYTPCLIDEECPEGQHCDNGVGGTFLCVDD